MPKPTTRARFTVRKLAPLIGAEIEGVDLKDVGDELFAEIHQAMLDYQVLVFPKQAITYDDQIRFSERFGELEDFPERSKRSGATARIFRVSNCDEQGKLLDETSPQVQYSLITQCWHTDSAYRKFPSKVSFLHALKVPGPGNGGETEWANQYVAYERLSPAMLARVQGKLGIQDYRETRNYVKGLPPLTPEEEARYPQVKHKMIRTHPDTGRKALYISAIGPNVEGMTREESVEFMNELIRHSTQPDSTYRHTWRVNDFVLWDNRCTIHRGLPWEWKRIPRVMNRTCVAGDGPVV